MEQDRKYNMVPYRIKIMGVLVIPSRYSIPFIKEIKGLT